MLSPYLLVRTKNLIQLGIFTQTEQPLLLPKLIHERYITYPKIFV
ncbi:hypothetical protein THF5H11_180055 [Vibrio jasicida]|nr:hypothetical protein THF5H11_180055 [Vibrio jasicida]